MESQVPANIFVSLLTWRIVIVFYFLHCNIVNILVYSYLLFLVLFFFNFYIMFASLDDYPRYLIVDLSTFFEPRKHFREVVWPTMRIAQLNL